MAFSVIQKLRGANLKDIERNRRAAFMSRMKRVMYAPEIAVAASAPTQVIQYFSNIVWVSAHPRGEALGLPDIDSNAFDLPFVNSRAILRARGDREPIFF